jgi:hypothetical protein
MQPERVEIAKQIEEELSNRKGSNQYKSKVDVQNFAQAKKHFSVNTAASYPCICSWWCCR